MMPLPEQFADSRNTGQRAFPDEYTIWQAARRRDWLLVRLEQGERLRAPDVARETGWSVNTAAFALRALERDGCAVAYRPAGNVTVFAVAP
jgi:predicted ArsR family transcriptional regulator